MSCILCKTAGRPANSHWLSQCSFLPPEDRKALIRSCTGDDGDCEGDPEESDGDDDDNDNDDDEDDAFMDARSMVRRVGNMPSPVLDVDFKGSTMNMTLDSGATSNLMREAYARRKGIPIKPNSQQAGQADGVS